MVGLLIVDLFKKESKPRGFLGSLSGTSFSIQGKVVITAQNEDVSSGGTGMAACSSRSRSQQVFSLFHMGFTAKI